MSSSLGDLFNGLPGGFHTKTASLIDDYLVADYGSKNLKIASSQ